MVASPQSLVDEQVQHLRALAAGLASRALSGDRQVIETLLVVQNQLLELTHYLSGQQVEPLPSEAPAPADLTPFRVPAPPLREYALTEEELGQTSVSMPPAPWDLEGLATDQHGEEREA